MDPAVVAEIKTRLGEIERAEDVTIPLAVESGSRAWGFPSSDSDYDCRFIYVRRLEAAADLFPPRDVIETPLTPVFDVNGWDLAKALRLMLKGNAVVLEWLASPLAYRRNEAFCAELHNFAARSFRREAIANHYLHLLRNQLARHGGDAERIPVKKLFYMLRPAMALRFLRLNGGERSVPMRLQDLCASSSVAPGLHAEIDVLIAAKQGLAEAVPQSVPASLMEFILDEERHGTGWAGTEGPLEDCREQARNLYVRMIREFGPGASA